MIGYVNEFIRPLVLIFPNMSGYVKTFKYTSADKNRHNKLMSLRIDDDKLCYQKNIKPFGLRLNIEKLMI